MVGLDKQQITRKVTSSASPLLLFCVRGQHKLTSVNFIDTGAIIVLILGFNVSHNFQLGSILNGDTVIRLN